ncbi:AMP-binding protein [Antrihabitans spumae]|uniref:AMP-binding protein n=1 Tax=Antrihabitans spumae TaxID=3373370 RepID=A0ABW7KDW4_9NOCA
MTAETSRSETALRHWLTAPADGHGVYLADESDGWEFHSYAELADRSRRVASLLRARGFVAGDSACVVLPTNALCIAAFYGTWSAGGAFTPISPPMFEDLERYSEHLSGILAQATPRVVVTCPDFVDLVAAAMAAAGRTDAALVLDAATVTAAEPVAAIAPAGEHCLVQFTSGSTATPRGVLVGWDNLDANIDMICDVIGWREGDAIASWLPLYHDMGLIGALLTAVARQGDLYLMRPDQFVRDPARWLKAMQYAQHSPSPAFALGYIGRRVDPEQLRGIDLSGWRSLVIGSEPVPAADAVAFSALLGGNGFRLSTFTMAYGLAEATLLVTSSSRSAPLQAVRIDSSTLRFGSAVDVVERRELSDGDEIEGSGWTTGLGSATAASTVSIVDADGKPLPDGHLGEVVVEGASVARGYAGAAATATTRFVDGRLHTGDAGFLCAGELFVFGRMGTSTKVMGRSVYMEDVEARVADSLGIPRGNIAAVAIPDVAEIVVFIERRSEHHDAEFIDQARHAANAASGGSRVRVVTGRRGLIRRTSSGKPRRRHMWQLLTAGVLETDDNLILSIDYIHEMLDRAAELVSVPPNCTVLLEGSIAEGFGNDGSDIDFLIVSPGDEPMPTMPTVLFIDGRRVEIRTRSLAQLRGQVVRLAAGQLDEDTLNRVQRFHRARIVQATDVDIDAVRNILPYNEFTAAISGWWTERATQALRYAVALDALGAREEADDWARDGLTQQLKAWAATRGEGYLESKWLPHQLDRIGADPLIDAYRDLMSDGSTAESYLDRVLHVAVAAGAPVVPNDPDLVRLRRIPDVTTWPIGSRLHVVRDRRDVFGLSDRAAAAWRSVVFGQSLAAVIARSPIDIRSELAEFLRLGFVGLRWHGAGSIEPALAMCDRVAPYTPPPGTAVPALGIAGAARTPGEHATLSPLPAQRFAEAALTLIWSNVVAENAREDLTGAIKNSQRQVAGIAAHRLIAMCTRVVLSAFGIHPLPADVAPSTTIRRLLPAGPQRDELLERLDRAQRLRFAPESTAPESTAADSAGADFAVLDELLDSVREIANGSDFPSSFASREQWRATLDICYDWLRLGGYLNSRLPIDEARDLLESGGIQPHTVSENTTAAKESR